MELRHSLDLALLHSAIGSSTSQTLQPQIAAAVDLSLQIGARRVSLTPWNSRNGLR
jgi:hypothetical protein